MVTDRGKQPAQKLHGVALELGELCQHEVAEAGRGESGHDVVPEVAQQVEKDVMA
jgi:hypothetical protein